MNFKDNKGITLLALTITIIVMLIISSITIYNSKDRLRIDRVNKLYRDIESINGKIDDYYLKYGEIPTLGQYVASKDEIEALLEDNASSNNATLITNDNQLINPNDGDEYYVINIEKLEGLTLNYGHGNDYEVAKSTPESITTNITDVYIINKDSHQVYYPKGIVVNDAMYYCYNLNDVDITENISKIDISVPNEASITLSASETNTETSITAVVVQSDNISGVNISECRWILSTESKSIGTDASNYTEAFSNENETITLNITEAGTYYLHVLTIDNVGYKRETISNPITAITTTEVSI